MVDLNICLGHFIAGILLLFWTGQFSININIALNINIASRYFIIGSVHPSNNLLFKGHRTRLLIIAYISMLTLSKMTSAEVKASK